MLGVGFSYLVLSQRAVNIIRDKYPLLPCDVAVVAEDALPRDFLVDEFLGTDFYEAEFFGDLSNDGV